MIEAYLSTLETSLSALNLKREASGEVNPIAEAAASSASSALTCARVALIMASLEGANEESPAPNETVRVTRGIVEGVSSKRGVLTLHTLNTEGQLRAFLAFFMGKGNYHGGLISRRTGPYYLGCEPNGLPAGDHTVLGTFNSETNTLTGLITSSSPDGELMHSLGTMDCHVIAGFHSNELNRFHGNLQLDRQRSI